LLGSKVDAKVRAGTLDITLEPHQVLILAPDVSPNRPGGYDRYDRLP